MGPKKRARSSTVAKASKAQKNSKKTKSEEVRDEVAVPTKADSSVTEEKNTATHIVADKTKHATIIEKGHIFFFYRPKVDHHEVDSIDDVSRL